MSKISYRLKGHESFTPREGWIAKGLEAVVQNPQVFSPKNYYGADDLGVGANMAKSIRYWMHVMGLSKKEKEGEIVTTLGEQIYKYDTYIEEDFTMWVLHYNIVNNCKNATSWYLYFQNYTDAEYSKESLYRFLELQLEQEIGVEEYAEKSLKDDVNAILNMYCPQVDFEKEIDPEEKSICPFNQLGLIRRQGQRFVRSEPSYDRLSQMVVLYVICSMIKQQTEENNGFFEKVKSLGMDALLNGKGGVKNAFNMTGVMLNEYLDRLENEDYIKVNRTAGLDVIYATEKTPKKPEGVTRRYYESEQHCDKIR